MKKVIEQDKQHEMLRFRVHFGNLVHEIVGANPNMWVMRAPLQILVGKMADLVGIASRIKDPELNDWICQLALTEQSDPNSPNYDEQLVRKIAKEALELKKSRL